METFWLTRSTHSKQFLWLRSHLVGAMHHVGCMTKAPHCKHNAPTDRRQAEKEGRKEGDRRRADHDHTTMRSTATPNFHMQAPPILPLYISIYSRDHRSGDEIYKAVRIRFPLYGCTPIYSALRCELLSSRKRRCVDLTTAMISFLSLPLSKIILNYS